MEWFFVLCDSFEYIEEYWLGLMKILKIGSIECFFIILLEVIGYKCWILLVNWDKWFWSKVEGIIFWFLKSSLSVILFLCMFCLEIKWVNILFSSLLLCGIGNW